MIGLPVPVTVPSVKGIPWRYCSYWDEEPAAKLGISLLRLGICRPEDWTGSAVDFVERGFRRFCKQNRIDVVRRVWDGELLLMDQIFDMTYRERQEARADAAEPNQTLFLVGRFNSAASVPLGSTLSILAQQDPMLPAAFYAGIRHCLWKWMCVYDYCSAFNDAKDAMLAMEESELKDSVYPQVATAVPPWLRNRLKMNPSRALRLLREIEPNLTGKLPQKLVGHVLDMFRLSEGYAPAWPHRLIRQYPEIEALLEECDGIGAGCLLNWYEDDPVSACFDEQATYLGQNGPPEPTHLRIIHLSQSHSDSDKQVRGLFDYIGALLRSLASAAELIEIIRSIDDEHIREHRLQSALPVEPSSAGIREE